MNITLILVLLLLVLQGSRGYRRGMTKEISSLVAWVVTLFVISLIMMIYSSFNANETGNTIVSVIILVFVGLIYGFVRIVFKSIKVISKLPLFHLADKVLGMAIGLAEAILIVWLVYVLNEGGLLGSFGIMVRQDTANSRLLYMIYEYNYLAKMASGL